MIVSNAIVHLPPVSGEGSKPRWTPMEIQILERFYGSIPVQEIADKLHRTYTSVLAKAHTLKLGKARMRWSPLEIQILERFYSTIPSSAIADKLHRTERSVSRKAAKMGLRKSPERVRQMGAENVEHRWRSGFVKD